VSQNMRLTPYPFLFSNSTGEAPFRAVPQTHPLPQSGRISRRRKMTIVPFTCVRLTFSSM
jgi:hypothetical protein